MLDGFVVPHAHFRTVQGDGPSAASRRSSSRGQFPRTCSPARAESVASDQHLRAFAQLEAQVKAAQQQQPTGSAGASANVNARTLSDVTAGALAECFTFYTRLMTVESFTWPDFLATVFTKLAEHFASSANASVRSSILAVFQQSRAHVAQVNDPSKLIAHLQPVLTASTSALARTLALQLLETMPSLLQDDAAVHAQLLARLYADDSGERAAAIAATRAALPLAPALQDAVLKLVIGSKDTTNAAVLALLEHATASSATDAHKAFEHCGVLYHDLVDDRSSIHCLRAMTSLVALHPKELLESHLQLLAHVICKDPRKIVQNFALLSIQSLIPTSSANSDAFAGLLQCVLDQIGKEKGFLRIKHSALSALEQWSRVHALDEDFRDRVVGEAVRMYQLKPERFGAVSAKILANVVRRALTDDGGAEDAEEEDGADAASVPLAGAPLATIQLLLEVLHPSCFALSPAAWTSTLTSLEALCLDFPARLSAHVVSCLMELVGLASALKNPELQKHLFVALSHIAGPSSDAMVEHSQLLLRELSSLSADESSRSSRRALAVALFRVLQCSGSSSEDSDTKSELDRILTTASYASQADRYEIAKLAATHGYFRLGLELTTPVAAATGDECFGGWLQALRALCDAEASVLLDARVGLNSNYQLSRATTYLKAATTSRYGFEFQLQTLALRSQWSQLVLQAQQFAGEAEYSNARGAGREEALRDRFQEVSSGFRALRSALLGASGCDLDTLDSHARISELLAVAIDGFLLLRAEPAVLARGASDGTETGQRRSHIQKTCKALDAEIREKSEILQRIDASRRAALGGKVMAQLLKMVCAIPFSLPQQFFRLSMRSPQRRIASSAQFLTSAENSAFTSKPRPRSQLGVPFGTDFNSLLKGVLEVDSGSKSFWRQMVTSLEVEVLVSLVDKNSAPRLSAQGVPEGAGDAHRNVYECIHARIPVDWSKAVPQRTAESSSPSSLLYLPFGTPVHVRAERLRVKGSFQLLAKMVAVDADGGRWPLAPTGSTRGFIVY